MRRQGTRWIWGGVLIAWAMVSGDVARADVGPPVLPDLPQRGVRAPPKPKPQPQPQSQTPGVSKAPATEGSRPSATGRPAPSKRTPLPSDTPSSRTQTAVSRPTTPGAKRGPAASKSAVVVQRPAVSAGAAEASMGPLVSASAADFNAWAGDDQRWAAPLSRADTPPPDGVHLPGDRPTRAAKSDGYGPAVVVRQAEVEPEPAPKYRRPSSPPQRSATVVIAYRNFALRDALGRRQAWHLGSVEVAPFRRYFRLNFLTEAGLEGGEAARGGDRADFMVVQKIGVGLQYPHWVTPFVEVQGGLGLMRTEVFERNDLGLLWSTGIDGGAQWAVTRWLYLHAAIGWVRPVLRTPARTVHFNRVAFKLGVGF